MTVTVHEDPLTSRYVVSGDLDVDGVVSLRRGLVPLLDAGPPVLRVDLSGVAFADCAGVRAWLRLVRDGRVAGTLVELVSPSAAVRRVLGRPGDTGH